MAATAKEAAKEVAGAGKEAANPTFLHLLPEGYDKRQFPPQIVEGSYS